jgi:hypothetical protein
MRVAIGKAIRVGPGDEVLIRGQLPSSSNLARLFVFAKEGNAEFSPYVENLGSLLAVSGDRPQMYTPMSMRLDSRRSQRELTFVADIDGFVRVMQEVDRDEPRAKVTLTRTICPTLPWRQKLRRRLSGVLAWIH